MKRGLLKTPYYRLFCAILLKLAGYRLFCAILMLCTLTSTALSDSQDASGSTLSGPVYLTLDACIQAALDYHIELTAAKGNLDVSRERIRQASRRLWPSLSLMASDNSALGNSGAFSQYDPSTGQRFTPGEGFQASADLSWSLYDFGNRRSVLNAEKETLQIRDLTVQQFRRDITQQVISLYLGILERQAELDVRHEQLAQAAASLDIATGRLEIGRAIAYEVLLEEAYLAQAESDLLSTRNALNQAVRSLLLLMRMDVTHSVDLEPPSSRIHEPMTDGMMMAVALENRLEFKRYDAEIKAVKLQLKTLQSSRRPNLDLKLACSQQGQDVDSFTDGDMSWSAGISLRFSPFSDTTIIGSSYRNWINSSEFMQRSTVGMYLNDGSSTLSQEIELRVTQRKLEMEMESLQDAIRSEILEAYEFVLAGQAQLSAREKNLAAMTENERIQQKQYELGLNQYKDVVDARADRVAALIALTRAIYSLEHYQMNLEYAMGLLNYPEIEL